MHQRCAVRVAMGGVHRTCEKPVDPDTCRTVVVGLKGAGGVLSIPSRVAWLVSGGRGKLCSTGSRDRHASPTPTLWDSNWSCNRREQRRRVCVDVTLTYWGTAYTWFAISFVYSTVRGVSIQYRPVATRSPTLCTVTELSIKFTSCPVMSVTFCMFHQATGLRE